MLQAKPVARERGMVQPKFCDSFDWSATRDLPPEQRAAQEESRALASELKRTKARAQEAEGAVSAQERQLCGLRAEVAQLQAALKECSVSPAALLQDQQFRQQLQRRCAGKGIHM